MLTLHSFWLSLATYRVRVALHLKGVPFKECAHDLSKGEHKSLEFQKINPAMAVPALEGGTQQPLTQSLAIVEWLEETYPTPPLLPADPEGRAKVRSLFLLHAADTHPLAVPRVQAKLASQFGSNDAQGRAWAAHWYREGLAGYEAELGPSATRCHGEALSIADLALASHLIGAERFGVELAEFPRIAAVGASLLALPAFAAAHPRFQLGSPGAVSAPCS